MSDLLVLLGLLLAVVGLVGLVRGRVGPWGLRNRTTSALVAAVGLVVALAAGAVSPAVSDTLAAPEGRRAAAGDTPVRPPSAVPPLRRVPRRRRGARR